MKKETKAEDDPFTLLGLPRDATATQVQQQQQQQQQQQHASAQPHLTASQVKAAYKKLSLQLHPDKVPTCHVPHVTCSSVSCDM